MKFDFPTVFLAKSMKSMDDKEQFILLRAQGRSYESIAEELGVSRQTLQNWSQDLKKDLKNAKAFRLDALRAKYKMLESQKVESFGIMLAKIKEELSKRDLSEVPTHKLLDMFLKYHAAINEHASAPSFFEEAIGLEYQMLLPKFETRSMP